MELEQAAQVCRQDQDGGFVWMGLFEPELAESAEVQARFGLHDLAVEDAQALHLRPKVEHYEEANIFFAVLRLIPSFRDVNDHLKPTTFLPLSFITGFFGMNFGWLVRNITSLWVFAAYASAASPSRASGYTRGFVAPA